MNDHTQVAIGLDIGTGGARAVAVSLGGQIIAEGRATFDGSDTVANGVQVEQSPEAWRQAANQALRQTTATLGAGIEIVGLSVDATSGTFLLVDQVFAPITPGIMYNDLRGAEASAEVAETMAPVLARFGIRIAPAFALSKIVYLARQSPQLLVDCRRIVHQTDWIIGSLTGEWNITDISTALKTGADPSKLEWPDEIEQLGIARDKLPQIVLPGTPIGAVTRASEQTTGVPAGTPVIAGCTDGTAGCLASGAKQSGDLNVTLGTTLVFKAVSDQPLIDPAGVLYNHRHPAGGYLPGAASSTGAEWIESHFDRRDLEKLAAEARDRLPTKHTVYPLVKTGERFPFSNPTATGFGLDAINDPVDKMAAGMEAVAMLERMAIDRFEQLGLRIGPTIFATGGGVVNETWLEIRAAVTRRCYAVPASADCAIGAAILAATPHVGGCRQAVECIVKTGRHVEPNDKLIIEYDDSYERFQETLRQRGFC